MTTTTEKALVPSLSLPLLIALLVGPSQPRTSESTKRAMAAFNAEFPPCADPQCEGCQQRRELAGEEPVQPTAAAAAQVDMAALAKQLDEASEGMEAAVRALAAAAKPGSAAQVHALGAQSTFRSLRRQTLGAIAFLHAR